MSQEFIRFVIPGEPVAKGRARAVKIGNFIRMYTPAATTKYEEMVGAYARKAMGRVPAVGGPLYVKIFVYLPIPESKSKGWKREADAGTLLPTTRADIDNQVKSILDGCNGIVWVDDCQITDLFAKKRYGAIPRAEIIVMTIDALCAQDKVKIQRDTEEEPKLL